jgi:L-alanine-DL-glutamate epimerase-like enolase superfamily enzyme
VGLFHHYPGGGPDGFATGWMSPFFPRPEGAILGMKDCVITDVDRVVFKTHFEHADTRWTRIWRDAHPGEFDKAHMGSHDTYAVLRIKTDSGHVGAWTGASQVLQKAWPATREKVGSDPASRLIGQSPFEREAIWQQMVRQSVDTKVAGAIDVALWDLAGRITGLPSHQLVGQCRTRIPTYVTTPINFGTPEGYAEYAVACKKRGYQGYKIHPYWFYDPVTKKLDRSKRSSPDLDIEVCRLTREAVGPDYPLMLDSVWAYEYEDALRVGRAVEELGYVWYECPMLEDKPEHWAPYARLSRELSIPVLAGENVWGSGAIFERTKMLQMGACDMMRIDTEHNGITACLKMAAICEAWPIPLELHGDYYGNITVLAATNEKTCRYLEWWDLDPDQETPSGFAKPEAHLLATPGEIDENGYFPVHDRPGAGYDIDWGFVYANRVDRQTSRRKAE